MTHRKVCVIGAGPCGLATVKNLLQAGIDDFICHEAQGVVGGLWSYCPDGSRESVYESAHTISSKHLSQFPDFPMPDDYPDYPSHQQIFDYFQAFAEKFALGGHIRLNSRVEKVRRRQSGIWEISGRNASGVFTETADNLIVSSGHHRRPVMPKIDGVFSGEVLHSGDYRSTRPFEGKRVLVVGAGNSACDIAAAVSRVASHVSLSIRTPRYIIPKLLYGRPVDVQYARLQRFPTFMRRRIMKIGLRFAMGRRVRYGLPDPAEPLLHTHPTLNTDVLEQIRHGKVKPRPGLSSVAGETVEFADGGKGDFDTIVFATGYALDFPFFEPGFCDWTGRNDVPLYLKIMPADPDNLYFIGMIQPIGCIWALADGQARLAAEEIAGRWQRPKDIADRIAAEVRDGKRKYEQSPRHALEVDFHDYRRDVERALSQFRFVGGEKAAA